MSATRDIRQRTEADRVAERGLEGDGAVLVVVLHVEERVGIGLGSLRGDMVLCWVSDIIYCAALRAYTAERFGYLIGMEVVAVVRLQLDEVVALVHQPAHSSEPIREICTAEIPRLK